MKGKTVCDRNSVMSLVSVILSNVFIFMASVAFQIDGTENYDVFMIFLTAHPAF
jgi:hypothetical protein